MHSLYFDRQLKMTGKGGGRKGKSCSKGPWVGSQAVSLLYMGSMLYKVRYQRALLKVSNDLSSRADRGDCSVSINIYFTK